MLVIIERVEEDVLNNIERVIGQFESEDPGSISFRYPFTRAAERTDSIKRDTIDIVNFKKVIEKLIYFLDWQWDLISYYSDLKAEINHDF